MDISWSSFSKKTHGSKSSSFVCVVDRSPKQRFHKNAKGLRLAVDDEEYSGPRISDYDPPNAASTVTPSITEARKLARSASDLAPIEIPSRGLGRKPLPSPRLESRARPQHPCMSPAVVSQSELEEDLNCSEPFPISPMDDGHFLTDRESLESHVKSFLVDFGGSRGVTASHLSPKSCKKTHVVLPPLRMSPSSTDHRSRSKEVQRNDGSLSDARYSTECSESAQPIALHSLLLTSNQQWAVHSSRISGSGDELFEKLPRRSTIAARPLFRHTSRSQLVPEADGDEAPPIRLDLGHTTSATVTIEGGSAMCETRVVPF